MLLLIPLLMLLNISFRDMDLASLSVMFSSPLTLENYRSVVADPATWRSLWTSVLYVAGSASGAFLIGLGTAVLLNEKLRGRRMFRTLLLVPWAVPGITATVGFLWILQPSFGIANALLRGVGLIETDINWFGSSSTALAAVIAPTIWKNYPFYTVMLLAAMQSVSAELYEAAQMDGASRTARFRWITWPAIRPYVVLAFVFNGISTFKEFDFIFAATRGGPSGATETIAIRIYNEAFAVFDFGAAAALGVLTFALLSIVVLVFLPRFTGQRT